MELKKLKARLSTATRGHKLLKDKSDEMIRRFSALIKENKRLRDEVEAELADCLKEFSLARSVSSVPALEKAFSMPSVSVKAEFKTANVMSVEVPEIVLLPAGKAASSEDAVPYSYAELTSEADYSVRKIGQVLEKLFRLAETEKTVAMLSAEIERNKRRVNALEYVMIPQLEETIAYIRGKLDENERAATTRLMKVKSMLAEKRA